MMAKPRISFAHRPSVEDSCVMVLLKLMYLKTWRTIRENLWMTHKKDDFRKSEESVCVNDVNTLPWSTQRTNSRHSCCCTVFARRPEIQNQHRFVDAPAVCQATCPLWPFGKYWIQWQQWRAGEENNFTSLKPSRIKEKDVFESNTNYIFLPLWQWCPGCSRCFWNRRTCVYAAQESPPQYNRGWINRRPSHSRGWSNPRWWCSESAWLFLSGRNWSLHRSLGIQPPTWKKWVKPWSTSRWVPINR